MCQRLDHLKVCYSSLASVHPQAFSSVVTVLLFDCLLDLLLVRHSQPLCLTKEVVEHSDTPVSGF